MYPLVYHLSEGENTIRSLTKIFGDQVISWSGDFQHFPGPRVSLGRDGVRAVFPGYPRNTNFTKSGL